MLETDFADNERSNMETVLYLSSNLVHAYAISVFFKLILGKNKYNRHIEVLSFLGYYLINSLGFLLYNNLIINLATNIIPLLIISLQYKKSNGQRIFFVCSIQALAMFIDLLIFSVLPNSIIVQKGIFQNISLLIFVFILNYFIENKSVDFKSKSIWLTVAVAFGTIIVGQLTINEFDSKSMIVSIILLLINLLNFYMYDKELKQIQMRHTLKLIETSNQAYQNQLKIMNESQKKIRFLRHDMKNHMFKVKKLISNSEYDKATSYINEMTDAMLVDNEYVNTGNNDVDCLLNYKLSIAKEIGVEFVCEVKLPKDLIVTSFDLTTILGNLLDNALNALKMVENKYLVISIKYIKGTIRIDLENTYNKEYEVNKKKGSDSEHGLGLLSVEQALEKYHGVVKHSQTEKKYYVNVFMYNSFE